MDIDYKVKKPSASENDWIFDEAPFSHDHLLQKVSLIMSKIKTKQGP
tara:strand:+ start:559 stop:699 length:141 start_codon:yes stop_codon:yes gene_type:complete